MFQSTKESLCHILAGYSYPEKYFKEKLESNVTTLMDALRDPSLPLLELQELISSIQGRIPASVEKSIHRFITQYANNLTSVLAQFPSQQIAMVIDNHANTIDRKVEREAFFLTVQGVVQLVQRYRNGIKGHMKSVIQDLLKQYLAVENLFQHTSYDKCITHLRELHKDNMQEVLNVVFSHANYANKNQLVIMLINVLFSKDPTLTDELTSSLQDLTKLHNPKNARVSLKARQVLIAFQQPPYEQRHNQMESMFLSAINMYGHKMCQDSLQKLILSETSIFDVLHSFYFHTNVQVRQAALEVYVRRSYIAYELNSVQHYSLSNADCLVEFQLQLPTNHPSRSVHKLSNSTSTTTASNGNSIVRVASHHDNLQQLVAANDPILFQRMGIMIAFENFETSKTLFDEVVARYSNNLNAGLFYGNNNEKSSSGSSPTKSNEHSPNSTNIAIASTINTSVVSLNR